MNEIIETAKDIAPYLAYAKPVVETILKPKLDKLSGWIKKNKLKNDVLDYRLFESNFNAYMYRTIEKCTIIDTLIFPNQQINIESIYQPLTLIDDNFGENKNQKIEAFPEQLFQKYRKLLICDSAGMGKSTLSKYICLQAIKEKQGIPVFIELRKLNSKNTVTQEFLSQLDTIDKSFDLDFVMKLLQLGEFIIILDGYDEIVNEEKEQVTSDLKAFILNCGKNYFLLTSRPEGALSTFGDFQKTFIKGLSKGEAYQLFKKFDKISKTNLSSSLIKEIRGVNNQVNEFLVNPFLASLLYKTYSFKRDIPSRKSTFYNEVYTALYQDHDLSKESYKRDKISKLDIQDFRIVLREFANFTAKIGEIEYDKPKAMQYLGECKKKLPFLDFKEANFIQDLLTTVPIFTSEGSMIKWAHKSFQDYFAAEYITYHPKKDLIINHLIEKDLSKYQNIIDLIIELDPNLIRHYVLPDILDDLVDHFNSSYQFNGISKKQLNIRRFLTFDRKFWYNRVVIKKNEPFDEGEDEFERVAGIVKAQSNEEVNNATIFNSKYIVSQTNKNRAKIIQILGIKGQLGKSLGYSRDASVPSIKLMTPYPVLISDESNKEVFNLPEHFLSFNTIMINCIRPRPGTSRIVFIPDITFCKDMLNAIKIENATTKNKDFLDEY